MREYRLQLVWRVPTSQMIWISNKVHFIKRIALRFYKFMQADVILFNFIRNIFDQISFELTKVYVLLKHIFYYKKNYHNSSFTNHHVFIVEGYNFPMNLWFDLWELRVKKGFLENWNRIFKQHNDLCQNLGYYNTKIGILGNNFRTSAWKTNK